MGETQLSPEHRVIVVLPRELTNTLHSVLASVITVAGTPLPVAGIAANPDLTERNHRAGIALRN
jgi:hypothetical protein